MEMQRREEDAIRKQQAAVRRAELKENAKAKKDAVSNSKMLCIFISRIISSMIIFYSNIIPAGARPAQCGTGACNAISKGVGHKQSGEEPTSKDEYNQSCSKLIAQFKSQENALLSSKNIESTKLFIRKYNLNCPKAEIRLLKEGVPATVIYATPKANQNSGLGVAQVTQAFITAMDNVKLGLNGAQLPKRKYRPVLGRSFALGVLKVCLLLLDKVQLIKTSFYYDAPSVFCYSVTLLIG